MAAIVRARMAITALWRLAAHPFGRSHGFGEQSWSAHLLRSFNNVGRYFIPALTARNLGR
jgi:hypothetical protein